MNLSFFERHTYRDSFIHRLDPRAKILSAFFIIVICVSTPPERFPAFTAYLLMLIGLIWMARIPLGYIFMRSLIVLPFVLMIALFVPFLKPAGEETEILFRLGFLSVTRHGLLILWNVLAKAWLGVTAIIWLTSTTPAPLLMAGFERLGVPRILIMSAGFLYRYLFVLADEALRMKRARDARCFGGRWIWHARVIGQMIGVLFLRSMERAERIYQAMLARGFDGRGVRQTLGYFAVRDALFLGLACLLAAVARFGI